MDWLGEGYLEAVDGEEAAEDALLEARPQHDHVVLLIHGGERRRGRRSGGLTKGSSKRRLGVEKRGWDGEMRWRKRKRKRKIRWPPKDDSRERIWGGERRGRPFGVQVLRNWSICARSRHMHAANFLFGTRASSGSSNNFFKKTSNL